MELGLHTSPVYLHYYFGHGMLHYAVGIHVQEFARAFGDRGVSRSKVKGWLFSRYR